MFTFIDFSRKFNKDDSIQILYDFVQSKFDEIQFEGSWIIFELIKSFPTKVLEDRDATLEKEGLCPSAILQIREVNGEDEDDEEDEEDDE